MKKRSLSFVIGAYIAFCMPMLACAYELNPFHQITELEWWKEALSIELDTLPPLPFHTELQKKLALLENDQVEIRRQLKQIKDNGNTLLHFSATYAPLNGSAPYCSLAHFIIKKLKKTYVYHRKVLISNFINRVNNENKTALEVCLDNIPAVGDPQREQVVNHAIPFIEFLLREGANPCRRITARYAVEKGSAAIVELLTNWRDKEGKRIRNDILQMMLNLNDTLQGLNPLEPAEYRNSIRIIIQEERNRRFHNA